VPFIDTSALEVIERLPGWYGRYFHSPSMTFAHYDFKRGSSIHEHFHPQEEVYEVIEGELELTMTASNSLPDRAWWGLCRAMCATRSKL
jgi:mannose-6-phosphate isomerase-like protein (cupin superfamily)